LGEIPEDRQKSQHNVVGANREADEDLDFDYSQTHLEDFLKSQSNNTLIKNSNI
jgi:hypothetical protein